MNFGNNREEAVSPVIGVILMVAITVILAAVVSVFVFGMADDVQGPKDVNSMWGKWNTIYTMTP